MLMKGKFEEMEAKLEITIKVPIHVASGINLEDWTPEDIKWKMKKDFECLTLLYSTGVLDEKLKGFYRETKSGKMEPTYKIIKPEEVE